MISRPPLPPPTASSSNNQLRSRSIPAPIQRISTADGGYLRMNSTSGLKTVAQNSIPPFSPSGEWSPPPSFQEATGYSAMSPVGRDGYLNPRSSFELQEKALQKFSQNIPETYLSPTADYETAFNTSSLPKESGSKSSQISPERYDHHRLRSMSCEDIKKNQMRNRSRTTNSRQDVNGNLRDASTPEPFPCLQSFKGSMELLAQEERGYYNVDGLKGIVDSSHGPTVAEVLQKFDETDKQVLTRAISNPNFFHVQNKDKLNDIRVEKARSNLGSNPNLNKKSKSLLNLFKRSNKDRSVSAKSEAYGSSRAKSLPNSPSGSLQRQLSHPNIAINIKGINVTSRTRSFRKPKHFEKSPQFQHRDEKSPKNHRKYNKSPQLHYHHERSASDSLVLDQHSPQPTRRTRHDVTPSVSSSENEFVNARPVCPSSQASSSSLGNKVHTIC